MDNEIKKEEMDHKECCNPVSSITFCRTNIPFHERTTDQFIVFAQLIDELQKKVDRHEAIIAEAVAMANKE